MEGGGDLALEGGRCGAGGGRKGFEVAAEGGGLFEGGVEEDVLREVSVVVSDGIE